MTPRGLRSARLAPLALLVLGAVPRLEGAPPPFRHERPVTPGARGANRLAVDVTLLAGSEARRTDAPHGLLSDLRIYAADGAEVPYLLIAPPSPAPEWAPARLLPIAATKTSSGFEADLGRPLPVDRLRVDGIPAPFLKRVRLEGSGDRARWTLLAAEGTLFDLPDEGLARTELAFPRQELRYLRVTWDDTRSGRVPLPRSVAARKAPGPPAPPRLRAALPVEKRGSEPGTSRYRLRLPAAGLPIEAIEVVPQGGNVLRPVRVLEARLSGGEVVPVVLGRGVLRRAERDGLVAASLEIPVATPAEAELELVVEDGSNPPLALKEVDAVLSPLPWIYFESAGGAPLVARFGARGVEAPRYDLEAIRPAVSRGDARVGPIAEAAWGPLRDRPAAAAAPASSGPDAAGPAAPVESSRFRVARPISPGPPGLTALALDAAVLSASPSLADVRIVGEDARQVPYLLETREEPLAVPLAAPAPVPDPRPRPDGSNAAGGRLTFYRLALPYPDLPSARLALETPARVFRRSVTLFVERRPGHATEAEPGASFDAIASGEWSHADPESAAPRLTLPVPPVPGRELYLAVDDGDNSPLPVSSPTLLLPSRRLRFVRPASGELRLLYGNPALAPPRYDLALLAPRLLGEPAVETALAPGSAPEPGGSGAQLPRSLFWGALAVAVIALLALVARLLRPAGGGDSPGAG